MKLYWHNLKDDLLYVIDLLQFEDGRRSLFFRDVNESKHSRAALSSQPYTGSAFRHLGRGVGLSGNVLLENGDSFVLDAHDVWLTIEEAQFFRDSENFSSSQNLQGPWINGLPPRFPSR